MTDLWEHQRLWLERTALQRVHAAIWNTRTGKSRFAIETAARQRAAGMVDAALVVSWPAGVRLNWAREFDEHAPAEAQHRTIVWDKARAATKVWINEFVESLEHRGLLVFSVNAEAISTAKCRRFVDWFLNRRKVILIADESDFAKEPGSLRTKALQVIADHHNVVSKRIMTATPATEHPLEFWSQYRILDPSILGHSSWYSFRNHYAVVERRFVRANGSLREFKAVKEDADGRPIYRNIPELLRRIGPYTSRVLRSDVTDAPSKVYQTRYYEMSAPQRRAYDAILRDLRAEGTTAIHVFARLSVLQHILGNRLPADRKAIECEDCRGDGCPACDGVGVIVPERSARIVDPDGDPRLDALMAELADPCPTIVWAKYRHEVDDILAALARTRRPAVRFDGAVPDAERAANLDRFQRGGVPLLVGNAAAGGRGLRMDRAERLVFYGNYFSLRTRVQAEDRAEAIGRKISTGIVDIVCAGSIDEDIVTALRNKRDLSATILDKVRI